MIMSQVSYEGIDIFHEKDAALHALRAALHAEKDEEWEKEKQQWLKAGKDKTDEQQNRRHKV